MNPLEREAVRNLDAVPGFDVRPGKNLAAEISMDEGRFSTPHHLAPWAG